jgi:lysozyme family protein
MEVIMAIHMGDGRPGMGRIGPFDPKQDVTYQNTEVSRMTAKDETLAKLIAVVIRLEGNVSLDSRDVGGLTKWGIAAKYYPEVKDPNFSIDQAFAIYQEIAIESRTLDIMALTGSKEIGAQHLQFAVNIGNRRALRAIQTVLKSLDSSIVVDGLWGPQTQRILAKHGKHPSFQTLLKGVQMGWYLSHSGESNQPYFLNGWINRASSHFDLAWSQKDDLVDDLLIKVVEARAANENTSGEDAHRIA